MPLQHHKADGVANAQLLDDPVRAVCRSNAVPVVTGAPLFDVVHVFWLVFELNDESDLALAGGAQSQPAAGEHRLRRRLRVHLLDTRRHGTLRSFGVRDPPNTEISKAA